MLKRGQASLWIIIGLVILILVVLGFAFKENVLDFLYENQIIGASNVPQEVESVNKYVLDCIHLTGENALNFVGFYGGLYDSNVSGKNNRGVLYYFIKGKLLVPSKEFIGKNIASYVNNNLKYCIDDFKTFNNSFDIDAKNVSTKVIISSGKVSFFVKYPIELKKGDFNYKLDRFNVDVNSGLNKIYNASVTVLNEQRNYEEICLTCLYDVAVANNLTVEIYNPVLNEVEYTFTDREYLINNQAYKFGFALRFNNTE